MQKDQSIKYPLVDKLMAGFEATEAISMRNWLALFVSVITEARSLSLIPHDRFEEAAIASALSFLLIAAVAWDSYELGKEKLKKESEK